MFPLGMALLPGGLLPLHVFEDRYRRMVQDCLAADGNPEFGQVLIVRGRETGGGDERAPVATVAQMVQVEALDDGRYVLVALGTRRVRIVRWLDDDPYPRAVVEEWPDDLTDLPDAAVLGQAAGRVARLLAMAAEADLAPRNADGARPTFDDTDDADDSQANASPDDVDISDDPVLATYHLATLAPIGPADRYRLLAEPGPARRLAALDAILDDVQAMLEFRLS
jgi:Lon protease-like protein